MCPPQPPGRFWIITEQKAIPGGLGRAALCLLQAGLACFLLDGQRHLTAALRSEACCPTRSSCPTPFVQRSAAGAYVGGFPVLWWTPAQSNVALFLRAQRDQPPLLRPSSSPGLSCSDTSASRVVTFPWVGVGVLSVLVIPISYGCVAASALSGQLKEDQGLQDLCLSLTAGTLFHGSPWVSFMYMRPSSSRSWTGTRWLPQSPLWWSLW